MFYAMLEKMKQDASLKDFIALVKQGGYSGAYMDSIISAVIKADNLKRTLPRSFVIKNMVKDSNVVIGDAARALMPSTFQDIGLGVEDAYTLGQALLNAPNGFTNALQNWQSNRVKSALPIVQKADTVNRMEVQLSSTAMTKGIVFLALHSKFFSNRREKKFAHLNL
eukprot:TRINITY_DN437_c0_g2_i1.p1 TRINITY_DN437_c0_g2~~TRINITY_DN437_c0_g2_i1.p1  ORF type:complete len:167 (-),score=7.64 TRINITY_DN437_c0_g2_i1:74-574(-)